MPTCGIRVQRVQGSDFPQWGLQFAASPQKSGEKQQQQNKKKKTKTHQNQKIPQTSLLLKLRLWHRRMQNSQHKGGVARRKLCKCAWLPNAVVYSCSLEKGDFGVLLFIKLFMPFVTLKVII